MPELNVPIPHFECLVRDEYLHDITTAEALEYRGQFTPCRVFGVRSHPGRALGFHVLLETGAQFAQLPIEALCHSEGALIFSTEIAQLWDCFGEKITCTVFPMLAEVQAQVWLGNEETGGLEAQMGSYMMSFDWWDNGWSDQPDQHKAVHLFKLDAGQFALQPNNRVFPWNFPSFTLPSPDAPFNEAPRYKAQRAVFACEARSPMQGDRNFFYGQGEQAAEDTRTRVTWPERPDV